MKRVFVLLLSLQGTVARAQSFPVFEAVCINGMSQPGQPVKLTTGGFQGEIAQILKVDARRSLVFTTVPLPNYGQPLGDIYTFKLVVDGKTVIATSETYGVPEFRSGRRLSLNFFLSDEPNGIYLQCQTSTKR